MSHALEDRPKFVINTCFICNSVFVTRKRIPAQHEVSRFQTFCSIMEVRDPVINELVPEGKFLCSKCDAAADELMKLQKQILELLRLLEKLRKILGKQVVDTFSETDNGRKNYGIKTKFFEVWKVRMRTSSQDIDASLQNRFASILGILEGRISEITADQRPLMPSTLRDPNNPIISPEKSEAPHANSNGSDIVSNGEEDRLSTECASPPSPELPDEDDNDELESQVPQHDLNEDRSEMNTGNPPGTSDGAPNRNETDLNQHHEPLVIPTLILVEVNQEEESSQPQRPPVQVQVHAQPAPGKVEPWIDKEGQRPILKTRRRTHPCKFCGKLLATNFSLQMHERTHTGEKPFPCTICGRSFNNKAAMQNHEQTHDSSRYEGEPKFECNICGKKYHIQKSLATHRLDHIKEVKRWNPKKPPNAPPKSKKTKKKKQDPNASPKPEKVKAKKEKMDRPKRNVIKKRVELDDDGNPIPNRKRIKRSPKPETDKIKRTRRPKGAPPLPAICSYCGKDFVTQYRLKVHLLVHTGEKPFTCGSCGRSFSWKGNLDKHMVSHDREKYNAEPKHVCDYCGEGFYRLGTLYHHRRRRHLGFREIYIEKKREYKHRPCECSVCGKKFDNQMKLSYHKARHFDKKHACRICGKPFFDSAQASKHAKKHEPTFWYKFYFRHPCPACPPEKLPLQSKPAMRKHWKAAHSDLPLPEKFVLPPTTHPMPPPGPGQHVCLLCEVDGKHPRYRHLRSLQNHNKIYHSENRIGKTWKPYRERYEDGTFKELMSDDGTSMSEDDSEFDDEDFDSENETTTPISRPIRKRKQMNFAKLLNDSDKETENGTEDEDSLNEEPLKRKVNKNVSKGSVLRISKKAKPSSRLRISKTSSSKLTYSFINTVCGGREIRINLTRIDHNKNAPENNTSNKSLSRSNEFKPDPNKNVGDTDIVNDVEIKHEIEEVDVSPDFIPTGPKAEFSAFNVPQKSFSGPIIIPNPLSKSKNKSPIVIPATSTNAAVDSLGES